MNDAYGKEMDANYAYFLMSSQGEKVPGEEKTETEKASDKRNIY